VKNYVFKLYKYLNGLGNEIIAEKQSKYMRNRFPFFGIMNAPRDKYWKEFQEEEGPLSKQDFTELARECIQYKERELWYIALQVIKQNKKHLKPQDLSFIKDMIVRSDWWDIVDILAVHAIGSLCMNYPDLKQEVNQWIESENFWLRRTAIIYQLSYRLKTDETVLYKNILTTCMEKEFFIRKAIGWALREYSKHNPTSVRIFIEQNRHQLSSLSIKEGTKYTQKTH
jgi:3-methyladenine DNA glycosylase AlkD